MTHPTTGEIIFNGQKITSAPQLSVGQRCSVMHLEKNWPIVVLYPKPWYNQGDPNPKITIQYLDPNRVQAIDLANFGLIP